MPVVYMATCRATGQSYVGCTSKSLAQRRAEHAESATNGSPFKFHEALRKWGLSSFHWVVLEQVPLGADMYARERYYVARYNTFKSGLNSTPGGRGSSADGNKHKRKLPVRTPYCARQQYGRKLALRR